MLRVRRRGTTRSSALIILALMVAAWVAVPLPAGAESISQTRGQIAALSAELSQEEKTSEITANEYDADKANLASLEANIVTLKAKEVTKRAAIKVTSKKLVNAVVREYVFGASAAQIIALFNQDVTSSDARQVYQDRVIGNLDALKATYAREKQSLQRTVQHVAHEHHEVLEATLQVADLLNANIRLADKTQATLATVTARLRSEIISYEVNAGAQAARDGDSAAEDQAISAASAVGGQAAANLVIEAIQENTPDKKTIIEVAGTAQGEKAVKEAESQIGVPYVWGGETPGKGFDCSGLVQWAWAQAGIDIPRTTEEQWPVLEHVPLTELQPGDLLFYWNLDGDDEVDHVVMYVGSGPWGVDTTIAAAYTGTDIALAPLFTTGLIGAARP